MQEKIFKIKWDDELGKGWMNLFNLELCLFSEACIGGNVNVTVEEVDETGKTILAHQPQNIKEEYND